MRPGKLSEMQRDAAWEGKSADQRQAETAFNFNLAGADEARKVGVQATGDGAARAVAMEVEERSEKERKEQTDRALMLISINDALAFADRRGADADRYEADFEARFGDAWREVIANRVMDPDSIPERRDGESMDEYRQRLEDELIERMIDPETGQIRPEYRDDPELRQYAEWALARHQEREARAYVERRSDPSLTDEQRHAMDEDFAASATGQEVTMARQRAAEAGEQIERLDAQTDVDMDSVSNVRSEGGFLDMNP